MSVFLNEYKSFYLKKLFSFFLTHLLYSTRASIVPVINFQKHLQHSSLISTTTHLSNYLVLYNNGKNALSLIYI